MYTSLRPRPALTAISLYTGAGGLDLGFEAAGFETRIALEMDDDCVATLRANRSWPVIHRSIHDVSSADLLREADLEPGEADVLIGGPPCQPFSKCGYWATGDARRLEDPRASTVEAYLRVLRDVRPRAFLIENVAGLAFRGKDEGIELIHQIVASINREQGTSYHVELLVLNAADFGVPQTRERAFLVGARDGSRFGQLAPTHRPVDAGTKGSQLALALDLPRYRNAWDAIGDLEGDDNPELRLRGKWADLLPSIPEGSNYLYHTDRGAGIPLFGWRRRFWNFLLKLAKDQPSWTLTAQPGPATGPFHWKNRRLSARELCRLQTLPDDYFVLGALGTVQRQLGNAVPSALAEVIALQLRQRLLGEAASVDRGVSLIPSVRGEPPPPEPLQPVADKFLHLAGRHEPHPGTGKGRRASMRLVSL
ncbi:MAG: DNA cytosine methyltransferase [Lamprobacter sp.]|uniref:DNA cytosine methyltransferase n=1 Tax=Lamprobacter sp. TaxID=3100796 RepID=UPI002B25A120|nr:DNA cytosine methyltransferase [Lamprobacter sp.]MEA3643226.1 DNA cytosine methyltransferase [Lamprobacter sp.]